MNSKQPTPNANPLGVDLPAALLLIIPALAALLFGGGVSWYFWDNGERLKAENSALQTRNLALTEEMNGLREQLAEQRLQTAALKGERDTLQARFKIKETELAYLGKDFERMQNELLELGGMLENALQSRAALSDRLNKWQAALAERDEILGSMENELARTYDQLDEAQEKRTELEQRLAEGEQNHHALSTEHNQLLGRLAENQAALDRAHEEIKRLNDASSQVEN